MNIFFIDMDPYAAAEQMVDKHVVKMIVESAQLLSTSHRILDGEEQVVHYTTTKGRPRSKKVWSLPDQRDSFMYSATHINHPSAIWARTAVENYAWLVDHFEGLLNEYTHRYDKIHKCSSMLYDLQSPPGNLRDYDWTTPPSCMDDQYKVGTLVDNYREYYRLGKSHIHSWKRRPKPAWI